MATKTQTIETSTKSISDYFVNTLNHVNLREIPQASINFGDGHLKVRNSFSGVLSSQLSFTPTERQLSQLYCQLLTEHIELNKGECRWGGSLLFLRRSIPDEKNPISFSQRVISDLEGRDADTNDTGKNKFVLYTNLPKVLTQGRGLEKYWGRCRPGYTCRYEGGLDIASKMVEKLRGEGHDISMRDFESALYPCVPRRDMEYSEVVDLMKKTDAVDFSAVLFVENWAHDLYLIASSQNVGLKVQGFMHRKLGLYKVMDNLLRAIV